MALPAVSVIILNYNGAGLLPECLGSLRRQDWPDLELVVADNASGDESRPVAESFGALFHRMDKNYGFSLTNNSAARRSRGDFLFFVNNDMRFDGRCLRRLVEVVLADESIFCADPMELDWEGRRIIHHAIRFRRGSFFHKGFLPWVGYASLGGPVEVPFGCAGSMLVRRSMFEKLAGFDETFHFDFEEVDLCWRAWLRGWQTRYVPQARVFHKVRGTFGRVGNRPSQMAAASPHSFTMFRRISGERNYLRFILKTMPGRIVALVFFREVLRVGGHLLLGDRTLAQIRLRALCGIIGSWPSILRARRGVRSQITIPSEVLIRRFLDLPRGGGSEHSGPPPFRLRSAEGLCLCGYPESREVLRFASGERIVECRGCGLRRTPPGEGIGPEGAPTPAFRDGKALERRKEELARTALRLLRRFISSGRVLDLGCAAGRLPVIAAGAGFRAVGLDREKWGWTSGGNSGPPDYVSGDAHELPFLPGRFEAVYMNHILEHLENPCRTLREAGRMLKKEGFLMIGVPNHRGLVPRLTPNWAGYAPGLHRWHFSPATLRGLLHRAGFRTVLLRRESMDVPEMGSPWKRRAVRLLRFLQGPIGMGDNLIVVARRGAPCRLGKTGAASLWDLLPGARGSG